MLVGIYSFSLAPSRRSFEVDSLTEPMRWNAIQVCTFVRGRMDVQEFKFTVRVTVPLVLNVPTC